MKYGLWLVLGLGTLVGGCVQGSTLNGSALVHPKFPYAVTYDDEQAKSVLGDEWRLENYRRKETPPGQPPELERKDDYETKYEFDFDDDDKTDATAKLPYPDLVFVHKKTNARLEVATVLLDVKVADKELRVLLSDIVESKSGTRSLFVGFGKGQAGVEKRFASRLLDSGDATLGDQKGLVATIERADVDQLQLNPKARWQRSRLFMVHAPFDYYVGEGYGEGGKPTKFHQYRVLLLVEYTNTPEDFEAQYPEFVRLLNKTHLLTDAMLLTYLGEPLSHCDGHDSRAHLDVTISQLGEAGIKSASGINALCSSSAIGAYAFAATGESHELSVDFDFSKPQKPAWLTEAGYKEQRQAAAADDTSKPDPSAPSAVPPAEAPPAAPAEAPPAAPAEAQPPAAPAAAQPPAASSPSSANSPESGSSSKP